MKHHSNTRRQGGFTLVEIAIVLMIVGLLIGGILRGQELIQSARVRNIIDQKSAIQTAYIGFLDRYRMLPGDLSGAQAAVVGNGALATVANGVAGANGVGDGNITWGTEGVMFFQNLTAAGFLSCGACTTVQARAAATTANSPTNVYGDFVEIGHLNSVLGAGGWLDAIAGITRLTLTTGGAVPSQVLAEMDRKADDGFPATGQLRYFENGGTSGNLATCAPAGAAVPPAVVGVNAWATPTQSNCQGSWLF